LIGDPEEDDAENLKLPGWLSILQDNVVNMAIIMTIFVAILMFAIGTDTIQKMSGTQHWSVYMLMTGLSFAVNVTIILTGVRMFVAELANSFKGISERLLKGAVVGVDCPALFAFSPNAWTLGFLATIIGQLVAIACLVIFRSPALIIAGFVPLFFDGGTVGVFSNRHGGVKAIFFFGIMLGLFQVFGSALIIPLTGMVGGYMGNFDWATVWLVIATVLHFIAGLFGVGGSTVASQMAPLGNVVALFGLFLSIVIFAIVLVVRRGQQTATGKATLAGKKM
jgi:PTS system ascorbate-specific IIC component